MQLEWNNTPDGREVSLNYFEGIVYPYVIRVTKQEGKLISRISTDNQRNAYEIYNRELASVGWTK